MKIRYKSIEHEVTTDAPFVGARISAISCKMKCKDCQNKDLKKAPTLTMECKDIIDIIKANPFNEGIILGGLEFSEQPLELLELVKEASERGLKVMIYTGCELSQFHARLGQACAKKTGAVPEEVKEDGSSLLWSLIGCQILDLYIINDYYIKAGRFDKDLLVDENIQFGVKLASANQKIYKIERVVE